MNFIGLNTEYPTADGGRRRRIHLDSAASPLACETALNAIQSLLPHYSNSHSYVHNSAKVSTQALRWAHDQVLAFVNASANEHTCVFTGSGTTAAINRVARGLASARPQRKVVFVSAMEHHANDLPHRQFDNQVVYLPLRDSGTNAGAIDIDATEALFKVHGNEVNYIAVSSVSNVTGINNPVRELTKLAHHYGAYVVVDGAQSAAHQATNIDDWNVDFFAFSGHKVYTPMSPGVLVARRSILDNLPGQDLGGGSVVDVTPFEYELKTSYPDREQSGTPNIVGAVALASVLQELEKIGLNTISVQESAIISKLIKGLSEFSKVTIYGDENLNRTAAVAFNHQEIDHGLLAAIFNDYFAIAVRNACFCAHPYVSSMLKESLWEIDLEGVPEEKQQSVINRKRGMVRVSLGLYSTAEDIDALLAALCEIEASIDELKTNYVANDDGSYTHKSFDALTTLEANQLPPFLKG